MEDRKFVQPLLLIIIFIIMGSAFAGIAEKEVQVNYIQQDSECFDYNGNDEDQDGLTDFIEDEDCAYFPYSNGNGESLTPPSSYDINENYQPYWDLTVDYVRGFVDSECGGNLAGCIGLNFANEVQFYCFFGTDIMWANWDYIFDKFFNIWHNTMVDDGSLNMYFAVCNAFPPQSAPTTLPMIEYQSSSPLPPNSGGSGGGK